MMKIYIMLAIVCVASAKNLNINYNNETEYYIDYNQNSNATEKIYGSSKFTKAVLDAFSFMEKLVQRSIDKDVENTTLSNNDIKNYSHNISDVNNKAEETTTEAPPVELYNKTLKKSLNDTDEIDVDSNNNKQPVMVPVELKTLDMTREYDKNQTWLIVSNDKDDVDRNDNYNTDKEETTEPQDYSSNTSGVTLSSGQADLNESNTETADRQGKDQRIYCIAIPENLDMDNDNDHNKDGAFEIIKPQALLIDVPHFKDSKVQPVTMPEELLVEDASEQVLHKSVDKPDIEAFNMSKSRHSNKIDDDLDSIKPLELRDVNLKRDLNNTIKLFYNYRKKLPNKTDYSIDDANDGKRAVSFEALKPQELIPEAPPVNHGSTQVGLKCFNNKDLGCLEDADDGKRPVSFDMFITEHSIPNQPPVEHGSTQVGLNCTHFKESGGCIKDTDDGRKPESFDVIKPEQPILEPPSVEHDSSQEGLNYTINKQTDKPNNRKQEDSTQKTITTTEVFTTQVASTEVPTAGASTAETAHIDVSTVEVSAADVSTTEVSSASVSSTEVSSASVSSTEVSSASVSSTEVSSASVSSTEVSSASVSSTGVSTAGVSTREESSTYSYDAFLKSLKDKKIKYVA